MSPTWRVFRALHRDRHTWAEESPELGVQAETGLDAIRNVVQGLPGHLQGHYMAARTDCFVVAFTREHVKHERKVEVEVR